MLGVNGELEQFITIGMSQAELAEQLAFSRDYMIDLESGKPTVHLARLFRVLHELGISVTFTWPDRHAEP